VRSATWSTGSPTCLSRVANCETDRADEVKAGV
jgi:hypothetical protein